MFTDLDKLSSLSSIGGSLGIGGLGNQALLSDCCGIFTLLENGVTGPIVIFNNSTGCNFVSEINAFCMPQSIPTLSQWIVFILGILFIIFGILAFRQRIIV